MSLKSTQGPIDVFLCPEDSPGVCSPVTGSSPSKTSTDTSPVTPPSETAELSQSRMCTAAQEVVASSPASTSSTVTAASQQDASSLVLGGDAGEGPPLQIVCLNYLICRTTISGFITENQFFVVLNPVLHVCSSNLKLFRSLAI